MNNSNLVIFVAELVGTFGLLIAATSCIVYDGMLGGAYGIAFIAAIHFVGIAIVVNAFGKYSMAHFNPAVTIAFFITRHTKARQLPVYFTAQAIGAFLGTLFVKFVFGDYALLGTNAPNLDFSMPEIIGYEILATALLMAVIYVVVHKKISKFSGIMIAGIIGLDVLFVGPISGASMNPMRSLSPAIVSGVTTDLWLYWTTPFIGTILMALIYRKKFLTKPV
uniref:Glycerol uptake facilitator family permease (AqpZ) n=1 Tax=uncultured marine thaumarchaeote AD1000_72_F04 TaxID=1455938 RepID=A0A075G2X3_9ARCH|nr:Glycerol uptake facilitator family permease (aqpZ) [uncultured marine thaumarchaeote AD1000_72_F04]